MSFALSTQGQGSTAYIAVSGTAITNASSVNWRIGGKHRIHSLTANAQIAGASNSTQYIVRIYTDGSIAFRTGATDRVRSSAGLVAVDVDFTWSLRNEVGVGMTLALNGTDINTFGTSSNFPINQLHRFSTTAASEVTTYEFFHEINGVLQSSWDDTNATGSGSTWDSSGPVVRTLTITSATGADDSWWIEYGGSVNQLSATLSSASSLSAGLSAVNRMAASLQSISALNANLTVGTPVTNLAATLSSASALSATLRVANRMSASLASSSAVSATLTAKHKLSASLQSVSSISASLTLTSGSVVFPIDVAGIPDGTYPVALFNHETGDFVSRTNVTFVAGSAEVASALPVGTEFSGYVIETGATPTVGAVVYGQVAYAS